MHAGLTFAVIVLFLMVGQMGAREPTIIQQGGRGGTVTAGGGGGAAGADGVDGYSALVVTMDEGPGVNCAPGGLQVTSGLDDGSGGGTARDEILQAGEVDLTSYVCDGAAGAAGATGYNALVVSSAESPGVNCADGGRKIQAGTDNGDGGGTAGNGVLEAGEIDTTGYACNGAAGATGPEGDPGSPGANGFSSLVKLTTESPGGNCAAGGKKVESGLDNGDGGGTANNGILEAGEVDATTYVCNGADGAAGTNGYNALVTSSAESPGANCADGGRKIQAGTDNGDGGGTAGNGVLEAGEIDTTGYACNGATGAVGADGADGNGFTIVDSLGSAFTSTSTTGAEVTGLTNTLSATGTYVFTYYLVAQTAATTTGIDFGINFDSTQTIIVSQMSYQDTGASASAGVADGTLTGDGAEGIVAGSSSITETTTAPNLNVITGVGGANENFLVVIKGVVITTASGELELWCATDVASSQVTVGTGSSLTIIKTG